MKAAVGRASAVQLDVQHPSVLEATGLDKDWQALQRLSSEDSPALALRKVVLALFERVSDPSADAESKQVVAEDVAQIRAALETFTKSEFYRLDTMGGAFDRVKSCLEALSGDLSHKECVNRLGEIWQAIDGAVNVEQSERTQAFVEAVLAHDAIASGLKPRFVRYAIMMANASIKDDFSRRFGKDGDLHLALQAQRDVLGDAVVAEIDQLMSANAEVRLHKCIEDKVLSKIPEGSPLHVLISQYRAYYDVVVDIKSHPKDAVLDINQASLEALFLPAQVRRNLLSLGAIKSDPNAFSHLLISLFRDYRDVSSLSYLAELYQLPAHLSVPVPLFEDPDIIDPKVFVFHLAILCCQGASFSTCYGCA